jgi:hypothetical protein
VPDGARFFLVQLAAQKMQRARIHAYAVSLTAFRPRPHNNFIQKNLEVARERPTTRNERTLCDEADR